MPPLRCPHDSHRDLRTRYLASTSPDAANTHDQARHDVLPSTSTSKCSPQVPSAFRRRWTPSSDDQLLPSSHLFNHAGPCLVPITDHPAAPRPAPGIVIPPRADLDVAARPRVPSRGFVLWRVSHARPKCVARSVMGQRPKNIAILAPVGPRSAHRAIPKRRVVSIMSKRLPELAAFRNLLSALILVSRLLPRLHSADEFDDILKRLRQHAPIAFQFYRSCRCPPEIRSLSHARIVPPAINRSIDANASLDLANHHPRDGGRLAGKRRCTDETVVQGYARKLRVAQALQPSTKGR